MRPLKYLILDYNIKNYLCKKCLYTCVFILNSTITFFNLKYSQIFTYFFKTSLLSVMYFLHVLKSTFRYFNDLLILAFYQFMKKPMRKRSFEKSLIKNYIWTIILEKAIKNCPINNGTHRCVCKTLTLFLNYRITIKQNAET